MSPVPSHGDPKGPEVVLPYRLSSVVAESSQVSHTSLELMPVNKTLCLPCLTDEGTKSRKITVLK